ncbi:hypothetical protein J6590_048219 [Homalodisca vitripennis]|nr:hypothetical protein J6590_048219 [Homalodisca vitripennis]
MSQDLLGLRSCMIRATSTSLTGRRNMDEADLVNNPPQAKCCENKTASVEEVNYCVEKCSAKYQESHNYCINEFNNYQHRLQRCVSECNDAAKDKLGAQTSSAEFLKSITIRVLRGSYMNCSKLNV